MRIFHIVHHDHILRPIIMAIGLLTIVLFSSASFSTEWVMLMLAVLSVIHCISAFSIKESLALNISRNQWVRSALVSSLLWGLAYGVLAFLPLTWSSSTNSSYGSSFVVTFCPFFHDSSGGSAQVSLTDTFLFFCLLGVTACLLGICAGVVGARVHSAVAALAILLAPLVISLLIGISVMALTGLSFNAPWPGGNTALHHHRSPYLGSHPPISPHSQGLGTNHHP